MPDDRCVRVLAECIDVSVPDQALNQERRRLLGYGDPIVLHPVTQPLEDTEWGEVNELKYLFRRAQALTRQEANEFLQAAWDYIGYQ